MESRLDRFPTLAGLPSGERAIIASVLTEERVDTGTELTRAGDFGWAMYAIEEGEGEVRDRNGAVVAQLGPGDVFGEVALVVSGRRAATVVARTPMLLLSLFTQDFQRIRPTVPTFEATLRAVIDDRLGVRTATAAQVDGGGVSSTS